MRLFQLPLLGSQPTEPKKTAGAFAPAIAPPRLEPKAAFWGQPQATEGEPGLS